MTIMPTFDSFALPLSSDMDKTQFRAWCLAVEAAANGLPSAFRDVLTSNRTYYVRADGSNGNDGLTNTSGGAFSTILYALSVCAKIDFNGYTVTIQVGAGTYGGTANDIPVMVGQAGVTRLRIIGDVATPSNCVISTALHCFVAGPGAAVEIQGFKLVSGSNSLYSTGGSIRFSAIEFGAATDAHMRADAPGGYITCAGDYTISGGAKQHIQGANTSYVLVQSRTVTMIGTPAFSSAYIQARQLGCVTCALNTYVGSATGKRYDITLNAMIQTFGAGVSGLPGSVAGTTATGGQYA